MNENPDNYSREEKAIAFVALRRAGCKCESPLIGYRPGVGIRCRLCDTVAKNEFDILPELEMMSQWLWVSDSDLLRNSIAYVAAEEIIRLRRLLKSFIG
jgi:hypothetical protein